MAERGVLVSYEAVRLWCLRFGQAFAKRLRGRQGGGVTRGSSTKCLSQLVESATICGVRSIRMERCWISWRRNDGIKHAAKRFFRKLLKRLQYVPHMLVTDQLASYGAARREILSSVIHCQGGRQNNRAEVSHQPTRQRERHMRRFKSPRQAQRFLSVHGPVNNLFRCGRHLTSAPHYRSFRARAFATWREVTCVQNAA